MIYWYVSVLHDRKLRRDIDYSSARNTVLDCLVYNTDIFALFYNLKLEYIDTEKSHYNSELSHLLHNGWL